MGFYILKQHSGYVGHCRELQVNPSGARCSSEVPKIQFLSK